MEINAEINKVFGQEMAKLFASSISDEEMQKQANAVWRELTKTRMDNWGTRKDSELTNYIKNEFLARLHEEIKKILKEPENQEALEKRAREIIAEARRVGEEAIIKSMAEKMVENTLSAYNVHDKFVSQVMQEFHVEGDRLRWG